MYDPYALFEKIVLPNGLTVYHQYWDRPWQKIEVIVHSGSREDPTARPGTAHFVEHCVSNNVDERPMEMIRDFFRNTGGGVMLGSTSYLATLYGFNIPSERKLLQTSLEIFGKMLTQGTFQKRVEEERRIIVQEYNQIHPFKQAVNWDMEHWQELFRGHRLEITHEPLGTLASLNEIKQSDLIEYYNTHYVPANMSIIALGGVDVNTIIEELRASPFGNEKPGRRNPIPPPFKNLVKPTKPGFKISYADITNLAIDQAIYTAYWAIPGDVSLDALHLASEMISYHLRQEIREKLQGSYDCSCQYVSYQDVYSMSIQGRVAPNLTTEMDERVMECMRKAREDEALFQNLNDRSLKSIPMTDISGKRLLRNCAHDLRELHLIESMQTMVSRREALKFEQVQSLIDSFTPDWRFTTIMSP